MIMGRRACKRELYAFGYWRCLGNDVLTGLDLRCILARLLRRRRRTMLERHGKTF
jgi:hypothetical protein